MLPHVQGVFTLVREIARESEVTHIAASKWLVQRHGLAPATAQARPDLFREDLARSTLTWARIVKVLTSLAGALGPRGVRFAPIKGAAYAPRHYRKPAERPMSDVDLLVAPGDEGVVERELHEIGFRKATSPRIHHAAPWVCGGLVVDVHRSIVPPGRGKIGLRALWERTSPGWLPGMSQLDPVDELAFHLIHLSRNRLRSPLIHVVDTARMLAHGPAGLGESALARAKEWGLTASATIAMRFCEAILDGDVDRPVGRIGPTRDEIALFYEPSPVQKIAFDIATAGSVSSLAMRALHFALNVRIRGH